MCASLSKRSFDVNIESAAGAAIFKFVFASNKMNMLAYCIVKNCIHASAGKYMNANVAVFIL